MNAAPRTTSQIPNHPGVDVTEENLAFFGFFFQFGMIVENPFHFHTREVGCQRQTNFSAEAILTAVFCKFITN